MSPDEKQRLFRPPAISQRWMIVFALLAVAGCITFIVGVSGADAKRTWQAYLVNYVFWTGLSFGSVLFVAILNMSNAHWGRPLKRLAESLGAFLPIAFVLFWLLYIGREAIFDWILHPIPEKSAYLNPGFMFARSGLILFVLMILSMALIYYSVKGDREKTRQLEGQGIEEIAKNFQPGGNWRIQVVLSPIFGILYAFGLSFVAFDLIMSLDPHWYSTLFGAYYFMGCFYLALAALYFLCWIYRKRLFLHEYIHPHQIVDLGKLVFAFAIFTGYLFYAQFLVIWYGNIPEETRFVILRIKLSPWEPLAWVILLFIFVGPFFLLLSRKSKLLPRFTMVVGGVIVIGMWLERFILVAPSLWKGENLPLGITEVLITAGFLGLVGLSGLFFLGRAPLLPVSDQLFWKAMSPHDEGIKP